MTQETHIEILHNDTCPICSREVAGYERLAKHHEVALKVDGLGDAAAWGIDPDSAARTFRVRVGGETLEGLAAFRALWSRLPGWRWLAWLTGLPGLHWIADRGYRHIAAPALYALHKRRQARRTSQ